MQVLAIWPSSSEHSCLIPQSNLKLYSCRGSVLSGARRRSLNLYPTSCHGPWYLSSYYRRSKNGTIIIGGNSDLKVKFFYSSMPKRFALTWASVEPAVGKDVADEELGSFDAKEDPKHAYVCDTVNNGGDGDGDGENNHEDVQKSGSEKVRNRNSGRVNVRALAYRLGSAKTADDVEEVFKGKEKLPLQVFSSIIRGFGKEKRVDPVMAIFNWLKRKSKETDSPIQLNLFIYNNTLEALRQAENFNFVEEIINDMAVDGVHPNVVTYNTLMGFYIEQGQVVKAIELFKEMTAKGISPSPASYSTVLFAYRRLEDGFGALSFFIEIRNKYHKGEIVKDSHDGDWDHEFVKLESFTTRVCYQVMRRWLVRRENLSTGVLRLLKEMDKAGLKPSLDENERLIWECAREEHHHVAKELYERIREMDTKIRLSVCNHVIWLMGKAKKWWAALEIYEDLLDKGPKPNARSDELIISHFNTLLTAAREKGIWRWGVRLLNKMEEKGLKPGSREWNSVLVACSKASETEAAIEIFKRMVEQGEKPTIVSYGALLSALEKGQLYDEALTVWKHMVRMGVRPNLYAYTIMASIYAGQGKFSIVDSVIREMVSVGVDPTVVTFNAIISSCGRSNMGSEAYEWFRRMKLQNVTPNEVTYEMLIEALGNDGKPKITYELYLGARNEGLDLSTKAYDAVVRSSQMYDAAFDVSTLGPRPRERRKKVQVRKNLSEYRKSFEK